LKIVTLYGNDGNVVEEVRIDGNLPKVILWGLDLGTRRVFLHDKGSRYAEVSWYWAPLSSYAGIGA
jgi:hypothetical protein